MNTTTTRTLKPEVKAFFKGVGSFMGKIVILFIIYFVLIGALIFSFDTPYGLAFVISDFGMLVFVFVVIVRNDKALGVALVVSTIVIGFVSIVFFPSTVTVHTVQSVSIFKKPNDPQFYMKTVLDDNRTIEFFMDKFEAERLANIGDKSKFRVTLSTDYNGKTIESQHYKTVGVTKHKKDKVLIKF